MPRKQRLSDQLVQPPIADVLKELGADIVPTGYGWVRIVCPFCSDRNGSASVNHDLNGFRCHQCGKSGDSLKLLQTELGLTFREAAERGSDLGPSSRNRHSKQPKRRASDLLKGKL